jgi:hypothetical protein
VLQVPGSAAVELPAGASLPLGAGAGGVAEEAEVFLPLELAGSGGDSSGAAAGPPQRLLLRSRPFSLSPEGEGEGGRASSAAHLVLSPPPPAARSLWRGGGGADAAGGWGELECRLGARVSVQRFSVASGAAAAAAVSVTLSPGCIVSNLTGLPLQLAAEGAVLEVPGGFGAEDGGRQQAGVLSLPPASTAQQPPGLEGSVAEAGGDGGGGARSRPGLALPHGATLPLLHLWRPAAAAGVKRQHARQRSLGSASDVLRSFSGALLPSGAAAQQQQQQQLEAGGALALRFAAAPSAAGAAAGEPAAPPAAPWSAALPAFAPAGRQRLYLQQAGGGGAAMLTHRVLLSGGSYHLVLFRHVPLAPLAAAPVWAPTPLLLPAGRSRLYLLLCASVCIDFLFHSFPCPAASRFQYLPPHPPHPPPPPPNQPFCSDRQPPFVVHNATAAALDLGLFPAAEAPDGGFAYSDRPLAAVRASAAAAHVLSLPACRS